MVLILDSNASDRQALKQALAELPVRQSGHGSEALGIMRARKPFVIIIGDELADMSGGEFLMMMRGNREFDNVAAILYTAEATAKHGEEGVVFALSKGSDLNQLRAVVEKAYHFTSIDGKLVRRDSGDTLPGATG